VAAVSISARRLDQQGLDKLCALHELYVKGRPGGRPLQDDDGRPMGARRKVLGACG